MSFKRTLIACAVIAAATTFSTTAFAMSADDIMSKTAEAGLPVEEVGAEDFASYARYASKVVTGGKGFSANEIMDLKKAFNKAKGNTTANADDAAADVPSLKSQMGKDLDTVNEAGEEADDAYDEVDTAATGSKSVKFNEAANTEQQIGDANEAADQIIPAKDTEEFVNNIGGNMDGKTIQGGGDSVFDDADDVGASSSDDDVIDNTSGALTKAGQQEQAATRASSKSGDVSEAAEKASDDAGEASSTASESSEAASEASATASRTAGQGADEVIDDGLDDLFSTGSTAVDAGQQIAKVTGEAGSLAGDAATTGTSAASTTGELTDLVGGLV